MELVKESLLQTMCDVMRHRGPDDEGYYLDGWVGLGIKRLSIIDLAGGHQPIFNESQTACLVMNGEIYNYVELRDQLEKRGHTFQTQSDSEVIIHAYEEWGEDCPQKFRGMFAFAIWDKLEEKLFIARDRLGQKPLYYYLDKRGIVFSSEIKTILKWDPALSRLNLRELDTYLTYGYVPAPHTMFEGISKLPAGHTLTVERGKCSLREYWDIEFDVKEHKSLPEYLEQLQDLLEQAIRFRLRSDVPLGALLSGGIDSSTVVGLMSQMMDRPVQTFSVGFSNEAFNEIPFARSIARQFKTEHHELMIDTCSPSLLKDVVWHLDEPIADPAAVPTYLISELARKHVKVILTGEGGDELFAGYDYYKTHLLARRFQLLPSSLSRRVLPTMARSANYLLRRQHYHERTIWHWSLPPGAQMAAWVAIFTDAEKKKLYGPAFGHALSKNRTAETFSYYYQKCNAKDDLHRLMYVDTKVWLPDDLLMKVDKMSMANSLEARTPFLDHHLIEFMASIPANLKLKASTPKYILKALMKDILPDNIISRPKQTFDVPIGEWLCHDLRDLTMDILEEGVIKGEDLFNHNYVMDEMWHALEEGKPGYARQFWSLITLGLWFRQNNVRVV